MKHTPGPWAYETVTNAYGGIERECLRVYGAGDMTVTLVSGNITEEKSNARLISAAPDLLWACQSLVDWANHNNTIALDRGLGKAVSLARQAISKAEGRE